MRATGVAEHGPKRLRGADADRQQQNGDKEFYPLWHWPELRKKSHVMRELSASGLVRQFVGVAFQVFRFGHRRQNRVVRRLGVGGDSA